MKILIDGENFRHQIADILIKEGLLPKTSKNNFFKFNVRTFFEELTGDKSLEIIYYTTRIKQPDFKIPQKLSRTLDAISLENRKWLAYLTNQKITIIKAGHLKVRDSHICVHCGKKTLILQEKGVDVRVATDLLVNSKTKNNIAIVSSDSDIVPALQQAKNYRSRITYICPSSKLNRSIASRSNGVLKFNDKKIIANFKEANND